MENNLDGELVVVKCDNCSKTADTIYPDDVISGMVKLGYIIIAPEGRNEYELIVRSAKGIMKLPFDDSHSSRIFYDKHLAP